MTSQSFLIAGALALVLGGCAMGSKPVPPRALVLANPDFESDFPENSNCPDGWGCVMHANPRSYRFYLDEKAPAAGKRSLCIEPITKEPWARAVQASNDITLRGKTLRFSVNVRLEGAEAGNAHQGGGAFVAAQGGRGEYLASKSNLVKGPGWQRVEAEIVIPDKAFVLEYGVAIVGPGRVCADDARLEVIEPPR